MVGVSSNTIQFNATLQTTDPKFHPVLIVGQLRHLSSLRFDQVRVKLEPRVTAETFENAIACLHPSPTDFCPLYLNLATVAALPLNSSRHNTSSRAHALTRLVKTHALTVTESIVVRACAIVKRTVTHENVLFNLNYFPHRSYVIVRICTLVAVLRYERFHYIRVNHMAFPHQLRVAPPPPRLSLTLSLFSWTQRRCRRRLLLRPI